MQRNALKVAMEPLGMTMTVDGWSNCNMQSIIAVTLVLGSSRACILWHSEDMSAVSHTGDRIADCD